MPHQVGHNIPIFIWCWDVIASKHYIHIGVSSVCSNKLLQTEWLKTAEIYSPTVLETRSLRTSFQQSLTPAEGQQSKNSLLAGSCSFQRPWWLLVFIDLWLQHFNVSLTSYHLLLCISLLSVPNFSVPLGTLVIKFRAHLHPGNCQDYLAIFSSLLNCPLSLRDTPLKILNLICFGHEKPYSGFQELQCEQVILGATIQLTTTYIHQSTQSSNIYWHPFILSSVTGKQWRYTEGISVLKIITQ